MIRVGLQQGGVATLLQAYTEQIFNVVNDDTSSATDTEIESAFFAFLGDGVTNETATAAADAVCKAAQDTIETK